MVLTLDAKLEAALHEHARRQGTTPENLALDALRARFLPTPVAIQPQDDWERELLALAKECGVSLPDEALSRETLYE